MIAANRVAVLGVVHIVTNSVVSHGKDECDYVTTQYKNLHKLKRAKSDVTILYFSITVYLCAVCVYCLINFGLLVVYPFSFKLLNTYSYCLFQLNLNHVQSG